MMFDINIEKRYDDEGREEAEEEEAEAKDTPSCYLKYVIDWLILTLM